MDLITIVSQNIDSVIAIIIAVTGSIFATVVTNKRRAKKEAEKEAERKRKVAIEIQSLLNTVTETVGRVTILEDKQDKTDLTLIKIETQLGNLNTRGDETHEVSLLILQTLMKSN